MFSVVIPLYNKAHTIVETLNSVLSQAGAEFEVVVVDDGSTDGGSAKIERHFSDPRLRVVHQAHRGVSAARNRGVQLARYDLIAFMDADDLWLPGFLKTISGAVGRFPDAGLYCCGGVTLYPDGSGYLRYSPKFRGEISKVDFFEGPSFFCHTSSAVTSKARFEAVGGFPEAFSNKEDHALFQQLALRYPVVYCPAVLGIYRKGIPGQLSADSTGVLEILTKRVNTVFTAWSELDRGTSDPQFLRFALGEVRRTIRMALAESGDHDVHYVLDNLDPRLLRLVPTAERFVYRKSKAASMSWIAFCRLLELTGGLESRYLSDVTRFLAIDGNAGPMRPNVSLRIKFDLLNRVARRIARSKSRLP